ncbi:Recombinase zinc beta ribbon domain-containing protein [Oscillibacter sp. PC13]|nr:Recombinase zinc beta ribbon domain-containing protein [Oscillibacter sp. PC13]
MKSATMQIFSGLVKCADCGCSMSFATNKSVSKPFSYFNCTSYRQYGPKHADCTAHYVCYDTLYAYVLSRLRYWSAQADVGEEHLKGQLLHANDREQQRMTRMREAELKRAQKRQKELDRLFSKLYEDWAAERITEYNFNALSEKYQTEQAEVLEKIEQLQAELATEQQATVSIGQWIDLIHQYAYPEELTAEMLNALIEKIVVHERRPCRIWTRWSALPPHWMLI